MLVRDANRLVAMAVIRSPQITGMEIQRIAGSTNVCDDVIRYIANSRGLQQGLQREAALVSNPKLRSASSLRLLGLLASGRSA